MDERELLEHYRPWIRTVARNMLPDGMSRHLDDLASEGWVAIWRARPDRYDAPADFILKQAAVRRMRDVYSSILVAERGGARGAAVVERRTILTDFTGPGWDELSVDPPGVEVAYHHEELVQALNRLGPRQREYVFLRFWCGWRYTALVRHFGYNPSTVWAGARKQLSAELGHLAEVAA